MKRGTYILLSLILFMTGCNKELSFTLKGKINGLYTDTLIAYYQIPEYKIDTIFCQDGAFEYSFIPDTTTVFTLLLNEQESLPIHAEKGQIVEIKGTTTDFTIKGKGENKLMNEIITLLRNTQEKNLMQKVDSLITTNNNSFTNLYLIDKYYLHNQITDYEHIEKLIDKQSGIIKDTPFIIDALNRIKAFTNKNHNQYIYTLHGKNREGKIIKWPSTRNHYILISFWASWHPESLAEQDTLEYILKELKNESFLIYSVSLDLDREAWLEASERDTTQWYQVCDFKGWNNNIVKSQNINNIPSNILLDKNRRIIARNIQGKDLIDKIKALTIKEKKKTSKQNR